jgi:MFS family permease
VPSKLSRGVLARLYSLAFLAGTAVGIWYFLPYFIIDLKGGIIEVGLVSTVPTLASACVQLSVGAIIDETKAPKKLLVVGFILSACCAIPFLFASAAWTVILVATVTEIFNSITITWGVANSIYISELTPAKGRAGIMSGYSSAWYLGNIVGSVLAGWLAPVSWGVVFLVFAGMNLVAGIFMKHCLPDVPFTSNNTRHRTITRSLFDTRKFLEAARSLPTLIRGASPEFASFCLALSIRSVGVSMVMPITAFYLADVLQASKPAIATLTAVGTAARIVPAPLLGWIADKWGRKKVFIMGLSLMIIYPIVYISARAVHILYLAYVMMGVGWACTQATFLAWQMELVPREKGRFTGLLSFWNTLAWAIGPLMGGFLGEYAGFWWGVGAATLAEFIGLSILSRVPERAS